MIKVENLSKPRLYEIGTQIGKSFMAQEGYFTRNFSYEECLEYFRIITEYCYKSGCLYAISENYEGFISYWTKKNSPKIQYELYRLFQLLKRIKLSTIKIILKELSGFKGVQAIYKNEKNYILIFMVAILPQHQGKGLLRELLEQPFHLAKTLNTPCVLDTDSQLKADKYIHCGMKVVSKMEISAKATMFTLEYK